MSFLCAIPVIASLFNACAPAAPLAVGYVEGEFVLLAPTETAQVREVEVHRGDRVAEGDTVAVLEKTDAEIAVAQSEAALAQAQAQLADLKEGKRPEEIAVLEARSLRPRHRPKRRSASWRAPTTCKSAASPPRPNSTRRRPRPTWPTRSSDRPRPISPSARLPARAEAMKAAESQVEQAKAALEQAHWRLDKRTLTAPSAGRIDDVIRNPGDIAGPSAPVISMLPDGAVKLKLYVPEKQYSSVQVGDLLNVRCDGCPQGLTARVSYISPDPEFTPPVIYSLERRQKLVYLIEARPEADAGPLKPGQIVDVVLAK